MKKSELIRKLREAHANCKFSPARKKGDGQHYTLRMTQECWDQIKYYFEPEDAIPVRKIYHEE